MVDRPRFTRFFAAAALLAGCWTGTARPTVPDFDGEETPYWLAQETKPVGRDDVLPAFAASAQSYGCSTEQIGSDSSSNIYGEMRSYWGVSASCNEGTIALVTLANGRVRIGCTKPTTRAACDALLRRIADAR